MRISTDLHTHTIYSHGKGTIEDNVKAAIEKGLKVIAISDHGPGHMGFGIKTKKYYEMRTVIDHLNHVYEDEIMILLGLEANIMNIDGTIDVDDEILRYADFVLAGYHFGSSPEKLPRDFAFHCHNYMSKRSKASYAKAEEANTKAIINAMDRYPLLGITHPGAKGPIDLLKVANHAAEKGIALEVNAHHGRLTVEDLIDLRDHKVDFFVSSDAHKAIHVARFDKALARLEEAGIPEGRILNSEVRAESLLARLSLKGAGQEAKYRRLFNLDTHQGGQA